MRWRYFEPGGAQEAVLRAATLERIDAWWGDFASRVPQIVDLLGLKFQWDLAGWMGERLGGISPDLMWEFGAAVRGPGHRLVITPEGRQRLRPLADVMVERAPRIPGWEFYPGRLSDGFQWARDAVLARLNVDIQGLEYEARIGVGNRIDIVYRLGQGVELGKSERDALALVATEAVLGEETLDVWIGTVTAHNAATGLEQWRNRLSGDALMPVRHMREGVGRLIQKIRDRLPDRALYLCNRVDTGGLRAGSQFVMKPPVIPDLKDDYPDMSDVIAAVGENNHLWQAQRVRGGFHSARYSRHGEVFCYLKIDARGVEIGERVDARERLKLALDTALIGAGLGCVTGGATGVRYMYLDLALTDGVRAIEMLKGVLRGAAVSRRSWVLFYDARLADEWVGVYPETESPPRETTA